MMKPVLLIVEDDDVLRMTLSEVFSKRDFNVFSVERGADALSFVKTNRVDITLLDLRLPDMDGLAVLRGMHEEDKDIMVIVVTAYPEVKTAVSAMKAGAYDYINKPFELEEIKILVDKALENKKLRSEVELLRHQKNDGSLFKMVGASPGFNALMQIITTVAKASRTPVLIFGETGTGKGLIANAIHSLGSRKDSPFIKINCSAIPDNLLESEMFGYERGAFTDAKQSKKGLFELASGGTIFLDEIGDMDIRIQPKLLQVLENQTFRKLGGIRDIEVDVRVIAATNRDVEEMLKEKKFREDLYYRLKVMVINVPSLRERKEDILFLAEHFIEINNRNFGKVIEGLSPECHELLLQYPWPGNIRELKNIIERSMILAHSGEILPEHLPCELAKGILNPVTAETSTHLSHISLEDVEREHILHVIDMVKGNKTHASNLLGISRLTLREKLKKYSIGA